MRQVIPPSGTASSDSFVPYGRCDVGKTKRQGPMSLTTPSRMATATPRTTPVVDMHSRAQNSALPVHISDTCTPAEIPVVDMHRSKQIVPLAVHIHDNDETPSLEDRPHARPQNRRLCLAANRRRSGPTHAAADHHIAARPKRETRPTEKALPVATPRGPHMA